MKLIIKKFPWIVIKPIPIAKAGPITGIISNIQVIKDINSKDRVISCRFQKA